MFTIKIINSRKQIETSKIEAAKDNVIVPLTLEDYCIKTVKHCEDSDIIDLDEDYYGYSDESDDEGDYAENDEDSGRGES